MKGIYKYTPVLQSPDTLKTTLVGREETLKTVERVLRNAAKGGSLSHLLLIGPKGIGKTHMLRTIYHCLKGEIDVMGIERFRDSFIPVIFSEEEYTTSVIKFLRLTIEYLKRDSIDIEIPDSLTAQVLTDEKQKEVILDFIKTFKKRTGRILLLLVDNFNDIIDSFTEEDRSVLRDILMTSGSALLIGTAPTLFQAILNHNEPFYNFFETEWLHDITFDETRGLLSRLAQLEGRADILKIIEEKRDKLRAIYELSGGNPRLIISLYQIMAEVEITSVEETFQRMLDEMSPYFSARMKDLSPQQREIMDVIAQAEQLLTPTEIASRCGLPVNQVNAQIKRLEEIGYLEKMTGRKRKGVLYDVKERLFSLWRQMRVEAGRQRLSFIVRFIEIWFTKEEIHYYIDKTLKSIKKCVISAPERLSKEIDKLWYLKEATPEYKGKKEEILIFERMPELVLEIFKRMVAETPNDHEAWSGLGATYAHLGIYDEAKKACKKAIELKPDIYDAWNNLGTVYVNLGKYERAVEAFKKAIEIKPTDHEAWNNLGYIYFLLGRYEEAVEYLEKAIKLDPKYSLSWKNLLKICLKQFTNTSLKKIYTGAINHLKKALRCIKNAGGEDEVLDLFVLAFIEIVKKRRVEALKRGLKEIKNSEYQTLKKGLSPFYVLVNYLETRDESVLQRLKQEERLIVNEMLKSIEKSR